MLFLLLSLQLVMLDSISCIVLEFTPQFKKNPSTSCAKIAICIAHVLVIKRSGVCAFLKIHRKCSVKTTYVCFLLHHNSSCIVNFQCYNELSVGVRSLLQHTINIQGSNTCESLPDRSAIGDDVIWITYELQATVLKK